MFFFHGTRNPQFKSCDFLNYDEYWKALSHSKVEIRSFLRSRELIFIEIIKEKSKVLDIACGLSPLGYELKKRKQCDVTVFDISQEVINKQKKKGLNALVQDISQPDFVLKDKYDYIVLSEIIEHLVFPEKLINKIKSNAKYLLISLPNSAFYRYRLWLLFKGRFFTQWRYHPSEHLRYWSHIDFLDWLEALDLKVLKSVASNGLNVGPFNFFNVWKNLFGHQIVYLCKNK